MKYEVVSEVLLADLVRAVNRRIEEGWVPQGGVCVAYGAHGFAYYQAMVKA